MDRTSFTEDAQVGDRLIAFDNFKKSTFKYHFEAQFNAAMTMVNIRKLERLAGIEDVGDQCYIKLAKTLGDAFRSLSGVYPEKRGDVVKMSDLETGDYIKWNGRELIF